MLNRRYQSIINSVVEFNFIKAPKPVEILFVCVVILIARR